MRMIPFFYKAREGKEYIYGLFPRLVGIILILFLVVGTGIFSPTLMEKVLPLIKKVSIAPGTMDIVVWALLFGILTIMFILLFRLNELAVACVVIINVIVDLYLALYLVSLAMSLIILSIFLLARSSTHFRASPRAWWLWILFLLLALVPTIQPTATFDSIQYYLRVFLEGFVVFWLGTLIARDMNSIRSLFKWLSIFGAFEAIVTIIQATTGVMLFGTARNELELLSVRGYQLGTTGISRAGAFLINPDTNACFLAMMLLITIGVLFEAPSLPRKVCYLFLSLLILLAMLLTYSTEGFLGTLAGIITFIVLVGNKRKRIFLIFLVLSVFIATLVFLPTQISALLQHATNPHELQLRSGAWQTGIRVIQSSPLKGIGLGNYVYKIYEGPYRVPAQTIPLDHPHDSYLEFAALGGIPVALVFLTLLLFTLIAGLRGWMRADQHERTLFGAGIAVVMVLSFVSLSDAGWTFSPLLIPGWLVLGVISSSLLTKESIMLDKMKETLQP